MKKISTIALLLLSCLSLYAQQYDGMHGLIHTPTAEMDTVGTARIGAHFISSEMMPKSDYFTWKDSSTGEKHPYNTFSYYISLTPFRWVELSYTCVAYEFDSRPDKQFQGVVGGITYRPAFARNMRVLFEWDGCHANLGADALLWRHLLLQTSLQNGRYFSAGLCYKVYLL